MTTNEPHFRPLGRLVDRHVRVDRNADLADQRAHVWRYGRNAKLDALILSKGADLSIYAVWAFVTGWLRPRLKARIFLLIFLMAHAVGTEWCQWLTRETMGRHGSLRDAALDQIGIVVGVIAGYRYWTASETPQAR